MNQRTETKALHAPSAMDASSNDRYPLSGVVVIDLSHIYNGPYATYPMALAGAQVIKIEPQGGEHLRHRAGLGGAALPFAMLNGNKQCVTLDLKSARGRALLFDMVRKADVTVENFAPGVTERLGIGPDAVRECNPRLIYASSNRPFTGLPALPRLTPPG